MNDPIKMILETMQDDIKELRSDVKTLLEFKWQIIGMATLFSIVFSSVISIVLHFMKGS